MTLFGQEISTVELTGTIFGVAGVWLTIKRNILCFPAGIINVALYAYLFLQSKLYADALLQLFYIVLLVYGWFRWSRIDNTPDLKITTTSSSLLFLLLVVCLASTLILGFFFRNYTDASLPYLDSLTTSMSLIAQWMIAKKKIENWLLWIVADIIYVWMYVYKNLYLTSVLYAVFIILAIAGYITWKKSMHQNISSFHE